MKYGGNAMNTKRWAAMIEAHRTCKMKGSNFNSASACGGSEFRAAIWDITMREIS